MRVGMGGPYGLDYAVFTRAAEDLGIETSLDFYILLQTFERAFLERIHAREKQGTLPADTLAAKSKDLFATHNARIRKK